MNPAVCRLSAMLVSTLATVSTVSSNATTILAAVCRLVLSVQFLDRLGHRGDMTDDSAEILLHSFLQEALVGSFLHGQGCPLLDVVHPAFPVPATATATLQGVLKDGFGEAVRTIQVSVS